MDFLTGLPLSVDWKNNSYDLILVIVDWLIKIVHYKPPKVTIDVPELAEVILDLLVQHHGFPDSIVTDKGFFFTMKFWSSLCYFLDIKQRLSTTFHPETDSQTERQNSTIESYLRPSTTLNKMTEQSFYQWPSLHIIIPRTLTLVIRLSNWTIVTTLRCHTRKMLTPAPSPSRQANY